MRKPYFESDLLHIIALRDARALKALNTLRDLTQRQLAPVARQILSSDEDVKRVVLDVYKYVWLHAIEYDATAIMPWLMTITEALSLQQLSRQPLLHLARSPIAAASTNKGTELICAGAPVGAITGQPGQARQWRLLRALEFGIEAN